MSRDEVLLQSLLRTLGSMEPGRGLSVVLQRFRQAGLVDTVASWISIGRNQEISPEQIQQGLGTHRVRNLAQCASMTESEAAAALAALLPAVVDQLTPDGIVPEPWHLQKLVTRLARTTPSGPGA